MITLPLVTTAAKTAAASSKGATADVADIGTDALTSTGASEGAQADSAGFLSLLGNKLLTLAQQGQTALPASTAAATAAAGEGKDTASAKTKLNALLAALDKPETLNALLQPAQTTVQGKTSELTETGETSDEAAAPSLTGGDMQALQALFAMLPPAQQPQQTATVAVKAGDAEAESGIRGGNATLASLLANTNVAASGDETAKGSDKSSSLPGNSQVSATPGTAAQKSDANTATLTSAFQQVLGQVTKESDKENSSSATPTTITPTALSAASVAVTPATTSLVSAPTTPQLNAQLGSPEWQQALNQQIVMFSRNGQQTAELHLHPQDLGSIQISLKLDSDQAQLSMVSNHSQVRAALEAAMPQLKEALAQNGINLGQSDVSSGAQNQSFSGQQDQPRNNSRGNTFSLAAESDSEVTPIAVPASLQARASGSNAVDIFA